MRVFFYDKTFEGLLSAVFDAYVRKEFPDALLPVGAVPPLLVTEAHTVVADEEKAGRVFQGLCRKLTREARKELLQAWLSDEEGAAMALFRYMRKVFDGTRAETDLNDPVVLAVHTLARKVCREAQHLVGFARFQKTRDNIYFAALAPRHDILPLILDHFADRFADQRWVLFDLNRGYGVFREGGQYHDVSLAPGELQKLRQRHGKLEPALLEENEMFFQELWKCYFSTTAIRERVNPGLQGRCMPRRYWEYMTEKQ